MFEKWKLVKQIRKLPRPPEYVTSRNVDEPSKYSIKRAIYLYRIEVTRCIRGDLVEIYDNYDNIVIEYVDQYFAYSGLMGTNDWKYDKEHLKLLNHVISNKGGLE